MLDPPPAVLAIFPRQLFVGADGLRVSRIADRVGRDLEAGGGGMIREREHFGVRMELQPTTFRPVGVWPLEPGAARSERAVSEQLDTNCTQAVAVEPAGGS